MDLNLLYQRMLCAKVEISPVYMEKKMKLWTVYDNGDDNYANDDDGKPANFDQKSSREPSAQVS